MLATEDPRKRLRPFASFNRALFETGAPILRAVVAARGDPEVAAIAERGDANRREGTTQLSRLPASEGALRKGLNPKDAAERLWLLTSAEQYLLATDQLGWTPSRYERWLAGVLEAELLEPDASRA